MLYIYSKITNNKINYNMSLFLNSLREGLNWEGGRVPNKSVLSTNIYVSSSSALETFLDRHRPCRSHNSLIAYDDDPDDDDCLSSFFASFF